MDVPSGSALRALQEEGRHSLVRLMLPLYRAFNGMAQEKYAERGYAGLTTAHTLLFANLDEGGTRIVVLAERVGTTKQFTGRLVHQLVERAYVVTEADPTDKRALIVTATPAGLRFFADACAVKNEIESTFKAIAGEEQIALLMGTLEKLATAFARYDKATSESPLGDEV